jgi:intracellular septation protein
VAFVVTYWLSDLKTAIVVIMLATVVQVVVTYAIKRTVSRMVLGSAALVVVLGGGSLLLDSPLVFKWKPTVLNWVFAAVFLGSRWIGDKPIAQRLMESVSTEKLHLSPADWQKLNLMWVSFFIISGIANIVVAYQFSEAFWVNFKLFGLMGLTLAFVLLQSIWLTRRTSDEDASKSEG